MTGWHRLISKIRESGPLYTLQLLIERVIPKFILDFRPVILCELDLGEALITMHGDPDIGLVERDELEDLMSRHEALGGMRPKLESEVRVWVLMEDDQVEAFMWLTPHVIRPSAWLRIELAEDEIAGVFLWVSPDRRGRGLGPRMNRHVAHECARAGYARIVSTVDSLNRNSLRADEKVGYRRIGKILVLRLCGLGGIFLRRMRRLGWRTTKQPLALPLADIERSLRGAP